MSRNSTVGQMLLLRYLARLLPLPRAPAISALHACAGLACDERDGNRHPRDGGLADVERACDISLRFAISKALGPLAFDGWSEKAVDRTVRPLPSHGFCHRLCARSVARPQRSEPAADDQRQEGMREQRTDPPLPASPDRYPERLRGRYCPLRCEQLIGVS
jgi:hypothetical protein